MYGVEKRFKMQLLLGLKGSPLVGVRIVNFVTPDLVVGVLVAVEKAEPRRVSGAPYVAIDQVPGALLGNFTNHVFIVYYAQVSKPKTSSR